MKLWYLLTLFLTIACTPLYQVYKLESSRDSTSPYFIHEDHNVQIKYDYWADGGILLFQIKNKLDDTLYAKMRLSNFVINNESIPYFSPTRYPDYETEDLTNSQLSYSPHVASQPIVAIAPNDSTWIEGFPISYEWMKINSRNQTLNFNQERSPLRFRNQLVFEVADGQGSSFTTSNAFWVSSIHECSNDRFQRIDEMSRSKYKKFYVKKSAAERSAPWFDATFALLDVLYLF